MNELELKYNDAEVGQTVFNEEALRAGILAATEKYKGLLVSEEGLKDAKADRAKLNKLKDSLNAARLEVKRRYMGPYQTFEKKLKDIISIIDEPLLAIDTQIKSFEEKAREEKKAKIKEQYNIIFSGISTLVPFEKVFLDNFLNTTFSLQKVKKELDGVRQKIEMDLQTLNDYEECYREEAKAAYLENLSLGDALRRVNYLKETKEKLARVEEQKRMSKIIEDFNANNTLKTAAKEAPAEERTWTICFKVTANRAQLMALKECLIKNHIEYTKSN